MVAKVPAVQNKQVGTSAGGASARENVKKQQRFKGVRMRAWGKWVSEIRLPNTRARLWLGSYASAEQAARAFDVAVVCLRGRSASLNFPDSPPDYAPLDLPHHQIVELAAAAASAVADSSPPSSSSSSQYSARSAAVPPSKSFSGSFESATSRHRLDSPATTSSSEEQLSETGTDAESSNCASSTTASMPWEQLLSLDEDAIDQCTESNVFAGLQLEKFGLPGSELGACVWPEDLLIMDWGGHSLAAAQPEHSALLSIDDESQTVDPEPSLLLWSF